MSIRGTSQSDLESRLFRKLQMIDDATTDQDLRVPPSNHFEKLRGNLAGFHSIRVNKQWRLVFRWDGGRGEADGRLSGRPQLQMRRTMLTTKRKPATVGEILVEEFMQPMGLTQAALAEAMGVQRKHVNELVQRPPERDGRDGAHPRPRVRQQPGLLAQRAAAQRSLGGDEQPERARADRARQAAGGRCTGICGTVALRRGLNIASTSNAVAIRGRKGSRPGNFSFIRRRLTLHRTGPGA